MKNQIAKITIFAFFLFVIFILFSIHYEKLTVNDSNSYARKINEIFKKKPLVIFLGDSHAATNIQAVKLNEKYVKLANGGDNLRQMLLKLDFAVRNKPTIKYAVIPIDFHSFSNYRYHDKSFKKDLLYSRNFSLISDLYKVTWFNIGGQLLSYYVPLISGDNWERYFLIISKQLEESISSQNEKTAATWPKLTQAQRNTIAQKRIESQLKEPIVHDEMVYAFDRLISFCKQNDIKLIGIKYPLSREYRNLLKKYEIDKVDEVYRSRRNRFMFINDYHELFNESPQYFNDSDHLSLEGSNKFTSMLICDIEKKIFQ